MVIYNQKVNQTVMMPDKGVTSRLKQADTDSEVL